MIYLRKLFIDQNRAIITRIVRVISMGTASFNHKLNGVKLMYCLTKKKQTFRFSPQKRGVGMTEELSWRIEKKILSLECTASWQARVFVKPRNAKPTTAEEKRSYVCDKKSVNPASKSGINLWLYFFRQLYPLFKCSQADYLQFAKETCRATFGVYNSCMLPSSKSPRRFYI